MKIRTGIFLFFWFLFSAGAGQSGKEYEKLFFDGNFHLLYQEYQEALPYFSGLVKNYPDNANLQYKTGICLLHLPGSESLSIPFLEMAAGHTRLGYNEESPKEKSAPPEAQLFLGMAYRINGQFRRCEEALDVYLSYFSPGSKEFKEGHRQKQMCRQADSLSNLPSLDSLILLPAFPADEGINYKPCLSGNGKVLVFMNKRDYYLGILVSYKKNGKWSEPSNITAEVESDGYVECLSLSYEGDVLFLSWKRDGQYDLFYSRFNGYRWTKLLPVEGGINSGWDEKDACLSRDNDTLYFSSNRPGGYGNMDIYTAVKKEGETWTDITNLRKPVNTEYDEINPCCPESGILYFSSNGHSSAGGFDIFRSTFQSGNWSTPENLGFPLNSTADDVFYSAAEGNGPDIISRYQDPEHSQLLWIHTKNTIPETLFISGTLRLEKGETSLFSSMQDIELSFSNREDTKRYSTRPDAEGHYQIEIPFGEYALKIEGPDIRSFSDSLSLLSEKADRLYNFVLQSRSEISPTFPAVYFGFDQDRVTGESENAIRELIRLLQASPDMVLIIQGHTDAIGSLSYNLDLSRRRAENIKILLTNKGISPERLRIKALGESFPAAPNQHPDGADNPAGRKINRRVDFAILQEPSSIERP